MLFDYFAFIHLSGLVIWQSTKLLYRKAVDELMSRLFIERRVQTSPLTTAKHNVYFAHVKELDFVAVGLVSRALPSPQAQAFLNNLAVVFIREFECPVRCIPIDFDPERYSLFDELYAKNLQSLVINGRILDAQVAETRAARMLLGQVDEDAELERLERLEAADAAGTAKASGLEESVTAGPKSPLSPASVEVEGSETPGIVESSEKEQSTDLFGALKRQMKSQGAAVRNAISQQRKQSKVASASAKGPAKDQTSAKDAKSASNKSAATQRDDYEALSFVESGEHPKASAAGAPGEKAAGPQTLANTSLAEPVTESYAPSDPSAGLEKRRGFFSLFSKELTADGVQKVVKSLRDTLVANNVHPDVADKLAEGVSAQLEGKQINALSRLQPIVTAALTDNISRVLKFQPRALLDKVLQHHNANSAVGGRPYVICMTGVNGVGKTTSIAKLIYLFREQGLKTVVCACDTFRSGAVEQLQTHCDNLGAQLFAQGYGKNASSIAKYGIKFATEKGADVCLIDTSGRQYNNAPLMQALGALVSENKPDTVIFVGEALTGTEGVEQLAEFDATLRSHTMNAHGVDGVILTKYDTCGNKVGACLNICYRSGLPIYYVGTGQSYVDFSELSPARVSSLLLS